MPGPALYTTTSGAPNLATMLLCASRTDAASPAQHRLPSPVRLPACSSLRGGCISQKSMDANVFTSHADIAQSLMTENLVMRAARGATHFCSKGHHGTDKMPLCRVPSYRCPPQGLFSAIIFSCTVLLTNKCCLAGGLPVSAGTDSAWPPDSVISCAIGAKVSCFRDTSATLKPSRANLRAMPAPAPASARGEFKPQA